MSITILTASDVDAIIKDRSTLDQALASQRAILTAFSNSGSTSEPPAIQIPLRTTVTSEDVTALCMPSRVKALEPSRSATEAEVGEGTGIGVKLVCVPHNSQAGLPATTTLFDSRTGQLKAVVNARNLTALRNACGMSTHLRKSRLLPGLTNHPPLQPRLSSSNLCPPYLPRPFRSSSLALAHKQSTMHMS